ncbi:lipid-A-disaccharide synthase, partial [Enterococcus faecium]
LQQQVTVPALVSAMQPLLSASGATMQQQFTTLHQQIRCDASEQAAKAILELIHD